MCSIIEYEPEICSPCPEYRYDVCVPEDPLNFTELYLVLELCDSDLKKLFKLPEYLSENHVATLLFNTLCG